MTNPARQRHQTWLKEQFDSLNAAHFDGKLKQPTFVFFDKYRNPVTQQPAWAGYTALPDRSNGMLVMTDEAFDRPQRDTIDTLLHELIHHAQATMLGADHQNHGPDFVAMANRIGASLGLGTVDADSPAAGVWPQTLRT